jgi:hypothetical protein
MGSPYFEEKKLGNNCYQAAMIARGWKDTGTSARMFEPRLALTALKDPYFRSQDENQSSFAALVTFPS